ncbi:MAG: NAD(P)/FAD-dependent oxidoreductase [Sphingobium sp.]
MSDKRNDIPGHGPEGLIRRRDFVSGLPLALALGASSMARAAVRPPLPRPAHVVVVGGGIIGVTIAWHLARRAVRVTVLDPTPGQGCTQGAFAMLIAGQPEGGSEEFNALYVRAVADWRRFQAETGNVLPIQWGGTVNWAAPGDRADAMAADWRRLVSWGVGAEAITAGDVARLCPGALPGEFGAGYFMPDQGAVDIDGVMTVLQAQAVRAGVEFRRMSVVDLPRGEDGRATIMTEHGPIVADHVILAAGAGTTALASRLGAHIPLDLVSGTLAHSKPMEPVLHRVLNGPLGSIKQNPNGTIVTGLDYAPGASGTDISEAYGRKLFAIAARTVPALKDAVLDKMTLGYVPIPAEGRMPIVGPLAPAPNVYVAAMMSGVTMAPLMARMIAAEVVDGIRVDMLAPYRPDRFNPQWNA